MMGTIFKMLDAALAKARRDVSDAEDDLAKCRAELAQLEAADRARRETAPRVRVRRVGQISRATRERRGGPVERTTPEGKRTGVAPILEYLKEHPGSSAATVQAESDAVPKTVYAYLTRLTSKGQVVRHGNKGAYTYSVRDGG